MQPTYVFVEPLSYPVVGCKIKIPLGTWIVESTDPDCPDFYRNATRAPVVHIEPQDASRDLVWWSSTGGFLRAGIWSDGRLVPVPSWLAEDFYRPAPTAGTSQSKSWSAKPCPVKGCRTRGACRRHNQYGDKLRAAMWNVPYEPVDRRSVYERDGWICGLCLLPVDKKLQHPNPMSVSLDHILPVSRGGGHLWSNVQCSHLGCNLRKQNRASGS